MSLDSTRVLDELAKVIDPELGAPITELDLIDDIQIDDGSVFVEFHLTAPYCPPMFAMEIANDVKDKVVSISQVKDVEIKVQGHYMSDYVNETVNSKD